MVERLLALREVALFDQHAGKAQQQVRVVGEHAGQRRAIKQCRVVEHALAGTLIGERGFGGGRAGQFDLGSALAVFAVGVEHGRDVDRRHLRPRRVFAISGRISNEEIGDRTDARQQQDDVNPILRAAGLDRVVDAKSLEQEFGEHKDRHGESPLQLRAEVKTRTNNNRWTASCKARASTPAFPIFRTAACWQ